MGLGTGSSILKGCYVRFKEQMTTRCWPLKWVQLISQFHIGLFLWANTGKFPRTTTTITITTPTPTPTSKNNNESLYHFSSALHVEQHIWLKCVPDSSNDKWVFWVHRVFKCTNHCKVTAVCAVQCCLWNLIVSPTLTLALVHTAEGQPSPEQW